MTEMVSLPWNTVTQVIYPSNIAANDTIFRMPVLRHRDMIPNKMDSDIYVLFAHLVLCILCNSENSMQRSISVFPLIFIFSPYTKFFNGLFLLRAFI